MGIAGIQDGSVWRAKLSSLDKPEVLLPAGSLNSPKQMLIDPEGEHMYICDREGLAIVRCRTDGTELVKLVITGEASEKIQRRNSLRWCVGIAIDWRRRRLYWTQKGWLSPSVSLGHRH